MNKKIIICGALLVAGAARAELPPATVRALQATNQNSVLPLSGTIKFLCGRCDKIHDVVIEGPATVVDASGLLLTSSSTVPILLTDRKPEIRESTLKVKRPDGTEVPLRVVLTDRDLDAILLAPEKPGNASTGAFQPVKWDSAAKAQLFDEVVIVGRMGQNYEARSEAAPAKINAVVTKPRTFYICALLSSGDGEAVFNAAGQLIGVGLGRERVVAADELQDIIEQARRAAMQKSSTTKETP